MAAVMQIPCPQATVRWADAASGDEEAVELHHSGSDSQEAERASRWADIEDTDDEVSDSEGSTATTATGSETRCKSWAQVAVAANNGAWTTVASKKKSSKTKLAESAAMPPRDTRTHGARSEAPASGRRQDTRRETRRLAAEARQRDAWDRTIAGPAAASLPSAAKSRDVRSSNPEGSSKPEASRLELPRGSHDAKPKSSESSLRPSDAAAAARGNHDVRAKPDASHTASHKHGRRRGSGGSGFGEGASRVQMDNCRLNW